MAGRGQAGRSGLEPITARLRQLFFTLDAFRGLPRCLALLALDQRLPDMGASRSGADLPQPTQPAAGRSQVSQTPCASQAGVAEPRLRDSVCGSIERVCTHRKKLPRASDAHDRSTRSLTRGEHVNYTLSIANDTYIARRHRCMHVTKSRTENST